MGVLLRELRGPLPAPSRRGGPRRSPARRPVRRLRRLAAASGSPAACSRRSSAYWRRAARRRAAGARPAGRPAAAAGAELPRRGRVRGAAARSWPRRLRAPGPAAGRHPLHDPARRLRRPARAATPGQADLLVGSPVANRDRAELEGLVGFFVNTAGAARRPAGRPGLRRAAGAGAGDGARRLRAPGPAVREAGRASWRPGATSRRSRSSRSSSCCRTRRGAALRLGSRPDAGGRGPAGTETPKFDLTLALAEAAEGLVARLRSTAPTSSTPPPIARLLAHFHVLLAGVAAAPAARLSDLPLLTEAERGQLAALERRAAARRGAAGRETALRALLRARRRRGRRRRPRW